MAELLLSPVTQHQIVSVTTVLTLRLRWLVTDSGSGGHHHHPDPHAINWNPSRPSLPQSIKIIFWDVSHCFVSWWIVKSTKPLIDESLPNVCKRRYKCLFHNCGGQKQINAGWIWTKLIFRLVLYCQTFHFCILEPDFRSGKLFPKWIIELNLNCNVERGRNELVEIV